MERMHNAKRGIVAGVINQILLVLLPFVSRTIIIYTLGVQYTGLGGLFASIINVLSLSELGFGAAVSYILYRPVAEGNDDKVCAILSFTRKCFRAIGTIILLAGLAITPFLKLLIKDEVPDGINIYVLFLIYLANVVISYMMYAYKRLLFSANQRYDKETQIGSATMILQNVIQIILLLTTRSYYLFVLTLVVTSVVNNLLCHFTTKKMFPQYTCRGEIDRSEILVLKQKIGGSFFSKLGETIYLSADSIVISAMFGLLVLGKYGNYHYVVTALIGLFAVIHNTLRPIIGNCIVTESKESNFQRFQQFNSIYLWLASYAACCLLCLYQDFITVWVGETGLFSLAMVVLFALNFMADRLSSIPALFVESAGLWWEVRFVSLTAAAVNLTLNIVLAKVIGLPGILIASTISAIFVNLVGRAGVIFRHYFDGKQFRAYLKETLLILALAVLEMGLIYWVSLRIPVHGVAGLIGKGIAVTACFGLLYVLLNFKNPLARSTWITLARLAGLRK